MAEDAEIVIYDQAEQAISLMETVVDVISIEVLRLRERLPSVNVSGRLERLRHWICGDYQSFVRVLGSRCLVFQPRSGRFFLHLPTEQSSLTNRYEEEEDNRVPVLTLSDLNWLLNAEENTQPDAGIRHRCEHYGFPFSPQVPSDASFYPRHSSPRMSTPLFGGLTRDALHLPPSHYSTVLASNTYTVPEGALSVLDSTVGHIDQNGAERIAALESELAKLKEQMALIVMAKEKKTEMLPEGTESEDGVSLLSAADTETERHRRSASVGSSDSGISGGEDGAASSNPSVALVPPPPPPPNPDFFKVASFPVIRKTETEAPKEEPPKTVKPIPSMTDVLKDLRNVKLKPVTNRSPGGTPYKRQRQFGGADTLPSDPGAFIAEALRRKFAGAIQEESPANDKENSHNSTWEATPEKTPKRPSSKRRSSFMKPVFQAE